MTPMLQHAMRPELTPEEAARNRFVTGMRSFILNDLAGDLKQAYDGRAAPAYAARNGHLPRNSDEAHDALRGDPAFNIYSVLRVEAQKQVWSNVIPTVEREAGRLDAVAAGAADRPGSVKVDPDFQVPQRVGDRCTSAAGFVHARPRLDCHRRGL